MNKSPTNRNRRKRPNLPIVPLIVLGILICSIIIPFVVTTISNSQKPKEENISYSVALEKMNTIESEITKVVLSPETNTAYLHTLSEEVIYVVYIPDTAIFMEAYNDMVVSKSIELEISYPDDDESILVEILSIIISLLPIFIWGFLIYYFVKKIKNMDISKTLTGDKKIKPVDTSNYSFNDVAGIDPQLFEVTEVVEMLKTPSRYRATGAKIPKGILLSGPPGTGKTLIAKAIAGEAGVKFYECSGSNFENMYVGVGASKVRELFNEARKNAPAIIFIDEIDAVAQQRYSKNSYSEQTLNQLLTEMDGFTETENIVFIAATNHIEVLDPAITRPGRFDRTITIPLPDCKGREDILKVHARNKQFYNPLEMSRLIKKLAKKTSGMSGATLENILNEAAINAARNNRRYIKEDDMDEAFIKIVLGISGSDKNVSDEQKRLVAVHEAGHAITSRIIRPETEILQASIIPRGTAGGYTFFADKSENTIVSKSYLLNDIIVSLGGRAAEQKYFNSISVGASSDLKDANDLAHKMIYTYAMGDDSQLVQLYGKDDYNKQLEANMFSAVKNIINDAYDKALKIMSENSDLLNALTDALIENSTLNSSELEEIFSQFNV